MKDSPIITVDFSVVPIVIDGRDLIWPDCERLVPSEYDIRKLVVLERFARMRPSDVFWGLDSEHLLQYALDAYDLEAIRKRGPEFFKAHFGADKELLACRSAWRGSRMCQWEMTFPALLPDGRNILSCPFDEPLERKFLVVVYQE